MNGITSVPYCPHEPTRQQRLFLALESFEAMYGGAAGGGKSDALLMAALQYVDVPGYSAIIFRRTHEDLSLPGALMDRADDWLRPHMSGAKPLRWDGQHKQWHFPSGAVLSFGYLSNDADRFRYKSAEFQYVGFDELTQFSEIQYLYLASRLRRLKTSNVPTRLRGATNPGDVGHAWVKARFVEPGDPERPFVRAYGKDNPHIDLVDYERNLSILDEATRKQLRDGVWLQDAAQLVYRYDSATDIPELPRTVDERL